MTNRNPRGALVAVYVMETPRGVVHYVGKSVNPAQRSRSHRATMNGRRVDSLSSRNIPKTCRMRVVAYATPEAASDIEKALQQYYEV